MRLRWIAEPWDVILWLLLMLDLSCPVCSYQSNSHIRRGNLRLPIVESMLTSSSSPVKVRSLNDNVSGDDPGNIFDSLNGGDDDDDDDGNSTATDNSTTVGDQEECVRADQYGDYGASTPYTDAALVAFTYQMQGRIQMSATTITQHIIPNLEAALSRLLVEKLFGNTTVCKSDPSSPIGRRRQRRDERKLANTLPPWTLDNGAQVTGLLVEPRDRIMNGHEGVLCQNAVLVSGAVRCFKLIGGVTLTGIQGNIDQAVEATQLAIQTLMNDAVESSGLEQVHESLLQVTYVAEEPDYHVYFGGDDPTPQPTDPEDRPDDDEKSKNEDDDSGRNWPIWPFLAVGASMVLSCLGCLYFMQRDRRRRRKGSFGGSIGGAGGRHRRHGRNKRLLAVGSSSSEESGGISESTDSMAMMDSNPHKQPISNSWRVLPNVSSSRSDDGEDPTLLTETAVSHGKTGRGSSGDKETEYTYREIGVDAQKHHEYFDAHKADAPPQQEPGAGQSIMTGSFPEENDGNDSFDLMFSGDPLAGVSGSGGGGKSANSYDASHYDTSGYGSSNYGSSVGSETDGTSDDVDDGSSSPSSDGSSPPPPRAWRRSVI